MRLASSNSSKAPTASAGISAPRPGRDDGTLCDIGQLGDALLAAIGELDHQNLDVLPVFSGRNTTAEIVAEHLLDRVTPAIDVHGLAGIMIRVWESPGAFAAFERMLTDR